MGDTWLWLYVCEKRPNLSYGDVDVGSEESKRDGSQQEIEVKIVLGVEHSNLGSRVQGWIKGDTLNLSICHLEGICLTDIPPIDRFAWKGRRIFNFGIFQFVNITCPSHRNEKNTTNNQLLLIMTESALWPMGQSLQ